MGEKMIERRAFELTEIRVKSDDSEPIIAGHSAVFEQLSEDLGIFMPMQEKIAKGAFKKTIKEADIRALWNHNPDYVLGRNKAKTLKLQEDDIGLSVEIMPPDTTWARDLMTSMERGDISQMSFGFQVVKDSWERPQNAGEPAIRTLLEVKLFDVSPVTFPAYPQTDVAVRAILADAGLDPDSLSLAILRSRNHAFTSNDRHIIATSIDALRAVLPEPEPEHSPEPHGHHSIAMLRRRLELLVIE